MVSCTRHHSTYHELTRSGSEASLRPQRLRTPASPSFLLSFFPCHCRLVLGSPQLAFRCNSCGTFFSLLLFLLTASFFSFLSPRSRRSPLRLPLRGGLQKVSTNSSVRLSLRAPVWAFLLRRHPAGNHLTSAFPCPKLRSINVGNMACWGTWVGSPLPCLPKGGLQAACANSICERHGTPAILASLVAKGQSRIPPVQTEKCWYITRWF